MEQDLFISPSTETTEAPSETIYSPHLLQLNVLQAFSLGQIQLINGWVTGSGSKSHLEKAVSHIPWQREKGQKTVSCACVCVPLLATLVWIFVAKCNFCATAGSLDVLGGHGSTRRNHLTCHKGSSKGLPLITAKTGANHFPSAGFCFSANFGCFTAVMQAQIVPPSFVCMGFLSFPGTRTKGFLGMNGCFVSLLWRDLRQM